MIYFHPGEIDFRNGNNGKKKVLGKNHQTQIWQRRHTVTIIFFFKFYEWLHRVPPVNAYSKEDRARFSSSIGVAYKQDISLPASPYLCVTVIINILIKRGKMNAYSRIYCWVRDCEKWLYTENPRGNGANRNHAPRLGLIDWLYSYSKLISSPRFQRMIIRLGLKCTNNLTTELIFVSGTVTQEASN